MHPSPTLTQGLQRPLSPGRRRVLLGAGSLAVALALSACASFTPSAESRPPIVFVHGNGDSAALWQIGRAHV